MNLDIITPHETLQLHELLTIKSLSLTKTVVMAPLVTDPDLKEIMKRDSASCENHIRELRTYMDRPAAILGGSTGSAARREVNSR